MTSTASEDIAVTSQARSAVAAMSMCVALLIASEFLPVSLLTPIASDMHATQGMAGQAISVSGLFAVITSLLIPSFAARFDRRAILTSLSAVMLCSLILIASASNFPILIAARALLGITVGGFWALATATVMRMVPDEFVPKALGMLYMGNALAAALAAPLGSYLGGIIGWRGVFWALVPFVILNLIWLWRKLPSIKPDSSRQSTNVLTLLKRRNIAFAMLAVTLSYMGAFTTFTYLRPFLENVTHADSTQLSLLLLGLGLAGFIGTYCASRLIGKHLYLTLAALPLTLSAVTLLLLFTGRHLWPTALVLLLWGIVNASISVVWALWLSKGVADNPEAGGGLMVAFIQLAIMLGASLGGSLLDHFSLTTTWYGGVIILLAAAVSVGSGKRLRTIK